MSILDETALKAQIRNKNYSRVYLFYGEENYLKQQYVNRIVEKTVGEAFKTFNLHNLEGKDAALDEIAECCEAMPMMDAYTVTVVHDMALNKLDSTELSKFHQLVSDISPSTILVFWMDTIEVDKRDKKWNQVISEVEKYGSAVNFAKKTVGELVKIIMGSAEKRGSSLNSDNARYLISVVGDDLNVLLNELEKVSLFAADREITKKDIDTVAVKSLEATTFGLAKALLSGNFDKAYEMLDILFFRKTEPTLILGTLISSYVDMYRAKVALTNGENATALASSFNYRNKEFRLTNGARDASKISIAQLRKALEILDEADKRLKTNFEEDKMRLAIEELMVRLMLV